METRLIPMTDYVHSEFDKHLQTLKGYTAFDYMIKVKNYANLLSTPLTLGMFVPCDLEGNVLKDLPKNVWSDFYSKDLTCEDTYDECIKYQQAKERVLFEGHYAETVENEIRVWTSYGWLYFPTEINATIEDVIYHNLTLTPNAVKQYKI